MEQILVVIHVFIAAALIGMVLLQRSDTDGFGLGSGGGSGLLSGRAQANLLMRTTGILAALFIANSLLLSALAAHNRAPSIVDTIEQEQTQSAPAVPANDSEKVAVTPEQSLAPTTTKPVHKPAAVDDHKPAVPNAGADVKPVKATSSAKKSGDAKGSEHE